MKGVDTESIMNLTDTKHSHFRRVDEEYQQPLTDLMLSNAKMPFPQLLLEILEDQVSKKHLRTNDAHS